LASLFELGSVSKAFLTAGFCTSGSFSKAIDWDRFANPFAPSSETRLSFLGRSCIVLALLGFEAPRFCEEIFDLIVGFSTSDATSAVMD
jgi:hypothetical protein